MVSATVWHAPGGTETITFTRPRTFSGSSAACTALSTSVLAQLEGTQNIHSYVVVPLLHDVASLKNLKFFDLSGRGETCILRKISMRFWRSHRRDLPMRSRRSPTDPRGPARVAWRRSGRCWTLLPRNTPGRRIRGCRSALPGTRQSCRAACCRGSIRTAPSRTRRTLETRQRRICQLSNFPLRDFLR